MNNVSTLDSMVCQNDPSFDPRWVVIQCLRDKSVDFCVNGVGYRMTLRRHPFNVDTMELWLLGNDGDLLWMLAGRCNVVKPLEELPPLISKTIGDLEQQDEDMTGFGFKRALRHRAYVLQIPLLNEGQGWLRLERIIRGNHPAVLAKTTWGSLWEEQYLLLSRFPKACFFPTVAASFVKDELLLSESSQQYFSQLEFIQSLSSSFQKLILQSTRQLEWVSCFKS